LVTGREVAEDADYIGDGASARIIEQPIVHMAAAGAGGKLVMQDDAVAFVREGDRWVPRGHLESADTFDPNAVDTQAIDAKLTALAKQWSRKPTARRARRL
jgi:hypothetical protein